MSGSGGGMLVEILSLLFQYSCCLVNRQSCHQIVSELNSSLTGLLNYMGTGFRPNLVHSYLGY